MPLVAFTRKARQVLGDPVLQRWLYGRLTARWPGEPPFETGKPDYINWQKQPAITDIIGHQAPAARLSRLNASIPPGPTTLQLPGEKIDLIPEQADNLFQHDFRDTETLLGLHRFSWVPQEASDVDPNWVSHIWASWIKHYAIPDKSWAWHPYTTAERACNILRFALLKGLPGEQTETLTILSRHILAISQTLEYFGRHHTSNHLANNGRGLFLLGIYLDNEQAADLGLAILEEEANRIFSPSGILREESSHYHLLLTKNYIECWLEADILVHPAASRLKKVASKLAGVLPFLDLPGGFPLIGDVSPDCSPKHLHGLLSSGNKQGGWLSTLDEPRLQKVALLLENKTVARESALAQDGWHRMQRGRWHGLWHASPESWRHMPGHGHQDMGSFVLDYGKDRIFIDPGRRSYGSAGDKDCAAISHNTLTVNGEDPFPPNRPYYDETFRKTVLPYPVIWHKTENSCQLEYTTWKGISIQRTWTFDNETMVLADRVYRLKPRASINRKFFTCLDVQLEKGTILLKGTENSFLLRTGGRIRLEKTMAWVSYGVGVPATVIHIEDDASGDWNGLIELKVVE